jgi:hypothetical protein
MNHSRLLAFTALLFVPTTVVAQQKPPVADVKEFHVGFNGYERDGRGRYKVGMWAPLYVKIKAGQNGIRPKAKDEMPHLRVETQDSEDVSTLFFSNFTMEPNEERFVMSYARPGAQSDVQVTVHVGDSKFGMPPSVRGGALGLNSHLYVSLGDRIPDLQAALTSLSKQQPQQQQQFPGMAPGDAILNTWPRFAGFESDATLLPDHWFGYQAVDLLFLSTRDKDFLLQLGKDNDASRDRLKAIAQWVRRGGRLVIPVSPRNADVLAQVLQSTVWQPPLPVVPPREGTFEVARLGSAPNFARAVDKDFIGDAKNPLKLAVLEPAKMIPGAWDVLAAEKVGGELKPVIARMPYGLGSITYLAFPLDDAPFTRWDAGTRDESSARVLFLKQLLAVLAPRVNPAVSEFDDMQQAANDLSSQLQRSLDQFDVRIIPFGYVALFIILYIIIVGPLDFLLLKYVFKRLEWTWFTFPTVVIAVSIAAYYTAYAIKGHDLKINKVDVIDFDLRTSADAKGAPRKASVYGQTFFTILSPRIQNYTVGIEPNAAFWGQNAEEPLSADMLTWLGRADPGFGGMGARGGSQGFFRKPYSYNEDASGIRDVPIPVWTTKSFQAAWEVQNATPPLDVDLSYAQGRVDGKDLRLSGKITSKLPVDLENAWLIYLDKAYPLDTVPKGQELKIALEHGHAKEMSQWFAAAEDGSRIQTAQGLYNPSNIIRKALFNERVSANVNEIRNHGLRPLDLSWRLKEEPIGQRDQRLREAILVARVKFEVGNAETMTTSADSPLPTNLWLGALPSDGGTRPELAGILAQDTFVRIIIPVKPQ